MLASPKHGGSRPQSQGGQIGRQSGRLDTPGSPSNRRSSAARLRSRSLVRGASGRARPPGYESQGNRSGPPQDGLQGTREIERLLALGQLQQAQAQAQVQGVLRDLALDLMDDSGLDPDWFETPGPAVQKRRVSYMYI